MNNAHNEKKTHNWFFKGDLALNLTLIIVLLEFMQSYLSGCDIILTKGKALCAKVIGRIASWWHADGVLMAQMSKIEWHDAANFKIFYFTF